MVVSSARKMLVGYACYTRCLLTFGKFENYSRQPWNCLQVITQVWSFSRLAGLKTILVRVMLWAFAALRGDPANTADVW